tara:strand:+ start:3524 stop:4792 length:1269 start_codon:yes stop_codon:yes gene_type:complete
MNVVLPKELAYSPSLPSLPECLSQDVVLAPVNGGAFGPSQLIQFDLVARGFIDPSSLYIRYKCALTQTTVADSSTIRGTPVYSFFNKLETIFGSSIVESINNYNQVCNMMTNVTLTVSQKYGQQAAYGYGDALNVPTLEGLDGRTCVTLDNFSLAAPLPCILSSAEKLVPAGLMPNIRIQLTTESISAMFGTVQPPSNYSLTNVELCYTMIDFHGEVNDLVRGMGEQFYIKSQSFKNMGASLASGGTGATDLIYNMRLASIKSLFANFSGQSTAKCINGIFDSVDPTSGLGDMVFNIAGTNYPTRSVSTLNNKSAFLMELKKAVGALHSDNYNTSINTKEFASVDATVTTGIAPGKFYFGVNCEKLSSNGALLTGVSTQSSPISLRLSTSSAPTQSYSVNLIAMYDALIVVQPELRQASVRE